MIFKISFDKTDNYTVEEITPKIFDELKTFQAAAEENLRFFKEHLYPLVMLKKFNVTYKPSSEAQLPTIETREEHGLEYISSSGLRI